MCHCTHREILNKVRIGDFAVDVPSQLGRRFGTARSAVDLNFVADVVSRKTSSYYGAFVGEIYRRKKIENTDLSRGNRVVNPRPFINVPITYFFSFSCLKTTRALRSGVAVASLEATEAAAQPALKD